MKNLELILNGRVQGIGFRRKIQKFVEGKGVFGFVENLEKGEVRIVLEGEKKKLDEFVSWLKTNPGFSFIEEIKEDWKNELVGYKDFKIVKRDNFLIDKIKSISKLFGFGKNKFGKIPVHVALIPDGNRRWARANGLGVVAGHKKATEFDNVKSLFEESMKLGIKYFSIWGFSTENWKRDKKEIDYLFELLDNFLKNFKKVFHEDKIRFRHFGRKDRLPKKIVKRINELEEETKDYSDFNFNLLLDYGGRDELVRGINNVLKEKICGEEKKIGENDFEKYLDSEGVPDVDLIIRTSGEKRLSGLMPWQGVYAELYFTDVLFPDFGVSDLRKAVQEFGKRKRRFGGG